MGDARSSCERALQLRLVHLRPSVDALLLGLVVELLLGAPTRAAMGPQSAAATGRDVTHGGPALRLGFAAASPFLVHRTSGDFLGLALLLAAFTQAVLDVLVLPFALCVPGTLRHGYLLLTLVSHVRRLCSLRQPRVRQSHTQSEQQR